MLIGLVSALLTSGLASFHTLLTDENTRHQRIRELETAVKKTDPDVSIEIAFKKEKDPLSWDDQIEPFDAILYVSQKRGSEGIKKRPSCLQRKEKTVYPGNLSWRGWSGWPTRNP